MDIITGKKSALKLYELYIIRKIFGPFVIITLSITGIAWLSQSLRFIDFIVNKGLSIGTFFYLSTLILPSLMWVIIPAATFIAIIYAYNKLQSDSELVIYRATGIDNKMLIRPALIFSLFATLVSYSISLYFLPASYREFKDMQIFIRNNYASVLLQEGVFTNPSAGLTVYVKEKDALGTLKGLIVHDSRTKDKTYTVTAQEATLENTPKGPIFILRNGSHQEYNAKTKQFSLLYFDSYNLELNLFNEAMIQKRWREAPELFLYELFTSINPNEKERLKNISEGNYRITWPLYNILLCLIALIPFLKGEFSRRGSNKRIVKASIAAVLIIVLALVTKNLANKSLYLNSLMYMIVIFSTAFCFKYLTGRK
jgi:lipopolysaccharide export system permease protein